MIYKLIVVNEPISLTLVEVDISDRRTAYYRTRRLLIPDEKRYV